jgi:hypothetical protein
MNFIFVFQFIYFKVILISWSESRINTIHWNHVFLPHFLILISSFNIRFVRYWALWFFFFNLLFMRLSHSHDLDYEFDKLTQLIQAFFFHFLIDLFFFNFILQRWVDWELGFVICLDLFFVRLYMSYDS